MIKMLRENLLKRKVYNFFYVHLLFVSGLLLLDITATGLTISLLCHVLILSPLSSLIIHLKFNHSYIQFKNSILEWLGLCLVCVYSFWKFTDIKSYHVHHHQSWKTLHDPTASEIAQGKIKYYLGLTDPCTIPKFDATHNPKINFINQNFYLTKISIYLIVILLFGITAFFYSIIAQQFYFYVLNKIHDIMFHSTVDAVDKPWLFPIYFNDSWHVRHHANYLNLDSWQWPWINVHYWYYKLFFTQDKNESH